jgi:hypothetical protein
MHLDSESVARTALPAGFFGHPQRNDLDVRVCRLEFAETYVVGYEKDGCRPRDLAATAGMPTR